MSLAAEAAPLPPSDRLNRFVWFSVAAHVALLLAFTIHTVFFSSESLEYQSAVRVDLVGLPDKIKDEPVAETPASEPAKPAPEPVKQKEPETAQLKMPTKKPKLDPDAVNLEKSKMKQKDALNRLKQMSAFDKIQQELENEQKKNAAAAAAAKSKQIKGNVISSGSQLSGLSKIQAENYIGDVEKQIRQNWVLPQYLAKKNLSVQVRVKFDEKGSVLSAQVVKSSGNPTFDEIAIDTVKKSAPLPPPPEKFARLMQLEGILFGFPE